MIKLWSLRIFTFIVTVLLGAILIVWLNHFANTSWRTILYDFNLTSSCPRDPNLLISCTLTPIVNYLLIGIVFIVSAINSAFLVQKNKIYFIPIILMSLILAFIIGREIVEDITSRMGPGAIEVPMNQKIN